MRPSRFTIRARITGGSLVIAVLISVIAGIIIYAQVSRIVNDGQIAVLKNIEGPYLTALQEESGEAIDPPGPDQLVAVVDPDGTVEINTLPTGLYRELNDAPKVSGETATIPVGDSSYLVRIAQVRSSAGTYRVISAIGNDDQVRVLNQVAALLIGTIAGINLAFGAASWLIGTAALAPVGRLRRSAAELIARPGTQMLPVGAVDDEISQLARTLNELVGQLRSSADRERQIVSDASHELRTPLAILQTQLELAQLQSQTIAQMKQDIAAAQRTLIRLTALATSLLELSRIDSAMTRGSATVDRVAAEIADAADRGRTRVGARDVVIDYSAEVRGEDAVGMDVADIGRLLDNLISNSLTAIRGDGRIFVEATRSDRELVIAVTDTGGGMESGFVEHAFDRFSQADRARTGAGAGLGLPIVAGLVSSAHGIIALDNAPGAGLTARITLPLLQDSGEEVAVLTDRA